MTGPVNPDHKDALSVSTVSRNSLVERMQNDQIEVAHLRQ
jgi:hypothetical protein